MIKTMSFALLSVLVIGATTISTASASISKQQVLGRSDADNHVSKQRSFKTDDVENRTGKTMYASNVRVTM
jgi:lipopolysaccharide/colanic/teichoic acid biosynthesis glycosyltransferase